jgi:hypothetical protein
MDPRRYHGGTQEASLQLVVFSEEDIPMLGGTLLVPTALDPETAFPWPAFDTFGWEAQLPTARDADEEEDEDDLDDDDDDLEDDDFDDDLEDDLDDDFDDDFEEDDEFDDEFDDDDDDDLDDDEEDDEDDAV